MKKVVITGATGMIGRKLIEYLLNKNIEILAIIRKGSARRNFMPLHSNLKIIEYNLDELKDLTLVENSYDTFFHLAWDGTFGDSRNDLYVQNLNIQYSLDAVHLAKRLGCKTFIGAGSQAEYGRVDGLISPETKTNPENGYGIAKLAAGQMTRLLANTLGINHIWTRIFSIYGPYDGNNTMIMSSISNMLNGKSPNYTKGEQIWDYLYSEDIASALYLLGLRGKKDSTYCIGSGQTKLISEYIEIIKNTINPNIKLELGKIPYAPKQVMHLCADISSLTEDTGFTPKTSFEEGIKRTILWYKERDLKNEKN